MHKVIFSVVFMVLSVSGCTTINYSKESALNIKSVSFQDPSHLSLPESAKFVSHASALTTGLGAGLGGALGAVIVGGALDGRELSEEALIEYALNEKTPSLSEKIVDSFRDQVLAEGNLIETDKTQSDAHFEFEVEAYGIYPKPMTKSYMVALIISGRLIDKTGKVIWQKKESSQMLMDGIKIPVKRRKEWFSDTEILREGFFEINQKLVKLLVAHFQRVSREEILLTFDGYTPPIEEESVPGI